MTIRVATRRSDLALTQCVQTMESLHKATGEPIEIVPMSSLGDDNPNKALDSFDRKGLFVDDLRQAVLSGECDLAVHSLKDVPTDPVDGLAITSIPVRASAMDTLVLSKHVTATSIIDLPQNSIIGTSSARRARQITELRSDLVIKPIRGNVPTRVSKVADELDAVILADAGLTRLATGGASLPGVRIMPADLDALPAHIDVAGVQAKVGLPDGAIPAGSVLQGAQALQGLPYHAHRIPFYHVLPAPGQGAIAMEHREGDATITSLLCAIGDYTTEVAVHCERTILRTIEGGCSTPLGVFAYISGTSLTVQGFLASADGTHTSALRRIYQLDGRLDTVTEQAVAFGELLQAGLMT